VDVYGLVQHLGGWYAAGWCHLREDVRVFRLDRVQSLATEPETFERPADFDARAHVAATLATAPYRWHIEVILEAAVEQLRPLVPEGLAVLRSVSEGVLLESGVEHLGPFARFIISLGFPFRIVRPDALCVEVRRIGVELLEIAG
jgi:predicted DNA-binding transcriptional regulator YafY